MHALCSVIKGETLDKDLLHSVLCVVKSFPRCVLFRSKVDLDRYSRVIIFILTRTVNKQTILIEFQIWTVRSIVVLDMPGTRLKQALGVFEDESEGSEVLVDQSESLSTVVHVSFDDFHLIGDLKCFICTECKLPAVLRGDFRRLLSSFGKLFFRRNGHVVDLPYVIVVLMVP